MKKKRLILGRMLMVLGSLLVLSGLMLLLHNQKLEHHAQQVCERVLEQVEHQVEENRKVTERNHLQPIKPLELDGNPYLGVLTIPSLDLILPVQNDWNEEKLRDTPCVYSGSIQGGELVILGHNYSQQFASLHQLRQGDEIQLTDAAGNRFFYQVEEILVLSPESVEEMVSSGYDLSLFTCTFGAKARVTVRCTLQNEIDRYPVIG